MRNDTPHPLSGWKIHFFALGQKPFDFFFAFSRT
jgi:hypothetical protein